MQIIRIGSAFLVALAMLISCNKDNNPNPTPDPDPVDPNGSLKEGLIAYYPFNGNTNDASGNNLNGTAVGTTSYSTNRYFETGAALELNGTNYIHVADNAKLQLKKAMTIYLEFLPETGEVASLIGKRNINNGYQAFHLALNYSGPVIFSVIEKDKCSSDNENNDWSNLPSEAGSPVLIGCWNYVAAIFDGTTQKIYLNGKLVGSKTVSFGEMGACTPTDLRIGYWWNSDPIPFVGKIDEVRIYDRALTSAEITKLYKL